MLIKFFKSYHAHHAHHALNKTYFIYVFYDHSTPAKKACNVSVGKVKLNIKQIQDSRRMQNDNILPSRPTT